MIYISLGLSITIFGLVFLFVGTKRRWREIINGAITLTVVGIFIFVASIIAYVSSMSV